MEHNNDIEEFSGGGRISPESSATDFPKGTLGVGKNGKVWINQPDKNGRLSWKPTENEFPISSIFSFGYWDDETFDFQIKLNGKELFKLRYAYEYENSYLVFTYPNGGADRQIAGNLDELLDFFNDNFVVNTFDAFNLNPNINGTKITTEVKILISRLKFLINNKGLRSPEKPATPEPKFKIGDLVIRKGGTQVMTVIRQIYDEYQKTFDYDLKFVKEGTNNSLFENQLELYVSEKTAFQQIDFLNPSTEENDVLIKTMSYYSDGLTFVNSSLANLKFKLKDRIGSLEVLFDKTNNIIKVSEPSKNINVWSTAIQQKISDESITEITNLYFATLEKFIEIAEAETPSKDCEADPNKIISGQVKKFYDLNKTRIEKLDSKFSCKIVQALVSLSEYESCGSPSSSSLPKAKSDLLSRISNLKI